MTLVKKFILKQIIDINENGIKELFKKVFLFFKYFFQTIYDFFLGIVPVFLIRIISPIYLVRIQKMPVIHFANLALDPSIYHSKKKLGIEQPKTKFIDLFYISNKDRVYNRQLVKMLKRKLNFFSSYILEPIDRLNKFFPGWEKYTIEIFTTKREKDVNNLMQKFKLLEFTEEEEKQGKEMLRKFGLKDNDKFICLSVRDKGYQSIKIPHSKHDWSHNEFRNSDIDDFVLAADELASMGYYVFRIGINVEKSIKSKNKKVIDYANSKFRTDFMDVYLGAKCFFCISTGTGIDEVCNVFNRPVALISAPVGDLRTWKNNFLLLTKKHYSFEEKKYLSLSEIFIYGVGLCFNTKEYEKRGVKLINFEPKEIKEFALEMVEILTSKNNFDQEDIFLQNKFKKVFQENIRKYGNEKNKILPRLASPLHGLLVATFSRKFLKKNKWWLE